MRIESQSSHTVREVIERTAAEHADRPFLKTLDGELTYAQMDASANRIANGLLTVGIAHADNVLLLLEDCTDFIAIWIALSKIGAVEVPINRAYQGDLLVHLVNDSAARTLIVDCAYLDQIIAVQDRLTTLERLFCYPDVPDSVTTRFELLSYTEMLSADASTPAVPGPKCSDLAAILYTSGTTGASKGVMIYHAHAYEYSNCTAQALALREDDVYYAPLPLFHIAGQWAVVYAAMIASASVVLEQRFSVSAFWERIRRFDVTTSLLLDVMASYLLQREPAPDDADNSLDRIHMSALIPELREFKQRFGVRVTTDLASTEMCVPLRAGFEGEPHAFCDLDDHTICGRVVSDRFEVKLVDEHDEEVEPGTVGEMVVRGRRAWTLMAGYWNNPEATARAWRNLWFHTGDALYCDANGDYHFVDRLRDVIRRRGENISSTEVENAISQHPAVGETAVVGIASSHGGEDVLAVVTLKSGVALSATVLEAFLRERLPDFMVPRYIDFERAIPKTQTGKIQKYPLRQQGVTDTTHDLEQQTS